MQLAGAGSSDAAIAVGHLNARPEIAHPPRIRPHRCTRPTQGSHLTPPRPSAADLPERRPCPTPALRHRLFDTARRGPAAAKNISPPWAPAPHTSPPPPPPLLPQSFTCHRAEADTDQIHTSHAIFRSYKPRAICRAQEAAPQETAQRAAAELQTVLTIARLPSPASLLTLGGRDFFGPP